MDLTQCLKPKKDKNKNDETNNNDDDKKTDVLKETRKGDMRREEMCVCVNWERRGRES